MTGVQTCALPISGTLDPIDPYLPDRIIHQQTSISLLRLREVRRISTMDHNPGYSDEVAEECHDLIDRAEEEAHMHDDEGMSSSKSKTKGSKGGLESMPQKAEGMKEGMKEGMGKKMDSMKDTMGMKK